MHILADGLQFPEGPVAMADGSVLLVEIRRGTVTRIAPSGAASILCTPGGGPNGLAVGPDGALYCCNNGGFLWLHDRPAGTPADYSGGRIERIDPTTGRIERLYDSCGGHALRGPNDLVFDTEGGFYFTDLGKSRPRDRDHGGVYYARADGSAIAELAYPLLTPNGCGLAPDGQTLYVAETETARLWAFDLTAPGIARKHPETPHGGRLVAGLPGFQRFDSLAVEADGAIAVATLVTGAITRIATSGAILGQIATGDPHTTNLCFAGPGHRTAYLTLSGQGALATRDWPAPGLPLAWEI